MFQTKRSLVSSSYSECALTGLLTRYSPIPIESQRSGWKSDVYEHFEKPSLVYIDGDVHYKFVCKSKYVFRVLFSVFKYIESLVSAQNCPLLHVSGGIPRQGISYGT